MNDLEFVGRAGEKLAAALDEFGIEVRGKVAADFGSAVGGFVDCLLTRGVRRVYAVETGYGVLDWRLRRDQRVVVMERTNAMHVVLPEKVDLLTIDVGWTRQEKIIPAAFRQMKSGGVIISLVKPHYEAEGRELKKGRLEKGQAEEMLKKVLEKVERLGAKVEGVVRSPIVGSKGGNTEYLICLRPV